MKSRTVKAVLISAAAIFAAIVASAVSALIYCSTIKGGYIPAESELNLSASAENAQSGSTAMTVKIRLNNETGRRLPVVYGSPLRGKSFIGCSVSRLNEQTDFSQHLDQNLGIISKGGKAVEVTIDTAGLKAGVYEFIAWMRVKLASEEKSVLSLKGVRYDAFDTEIFIKSKPVTVTIS